MIKIQRSCYIVILSLERLLAGILTKYNYHEHQFLWHKFTSLILSHSAPILHIPLAQ